MRFFRRLLGSWLVTALLVPIAGCISNMPAPDGVNAAISALARGGVSVFEDVNTAAPITAPDGKVSAMRFTRWQVRNMLTEAAANNGYLGSTLDVLGDPPPEAPKFSQVLAAWIVGGDGPLAQYIHKLLPNLDIVHAPTTVFPSIAVLAFIGDIARPSATSMAPRPPAFDLGPYIASRALADGGACTDIANWVSKVVSNVTSAITANGTGPLATIWNGVISIVQKAISVTVGAFTQSLFAWVTRIATIAGTLMQISSMFKPWSVKLAALPTAVTLDETPTNGSFTATLNADPVQWPQTIVDCVSQLSHVDLNKTGYKDAPVTWTKEIGIPAVAQNTNKDSTLKDDKTATYLYQTITAPVPDPGSCTRLLPNKPNETIGVTVTITRSDITQVIGSLETLITSELPAVLQSFLMPYVQPAIDAAAQKASAQFKSPSATAIAGVSIYVEDPGCTHLPPDTHVPPPPPKPSGTGKYGSLPMLPCDQLATSADVAAAYPGQMLLPRKPEIEEMMKGLLVPKLQPGKPQNHIAGYSACLIGTLGPDTDTNHELQYHTVAGFLTAPALMPMSAQEDQGCHAALAPELAHFHAICVGRAGVLDVYDTNAEYFIMSMEGSPQSAIALYKRILDKL
jgi:hypothetical protein